MPEKSNFPLMSPAPNPQDFSSFEEYRERLQLHQDFMQRVAEIEKIHAESHSKEEYTRKMNEIGMIGDGDFFICPMGPYEDIF
ncbi:MAG: hypothetical protein PHU71_01020 [Candidatus Gracilibacteria bacterium]|nr:hypothetical protein [Candidatus Gracilibacteria bacterium]